MQVAEQTIKTTRSFSIAEIKKALNIPEAEELVFLEKREVEGKVNDYEIRIETREVRRK